VKLIGIVLLLLLLVVPVGTLLWMDWSAERAHQAWAAAWRADREGR